MFTKVVTKSSIHVVLFIYSSYNNNTHPIFKPILDPIILPQKPHNKSDWT
jgi:hypothetical protein